VDAEQVAQYPQQPDATVARDANPFAVKDEGVV